LTKGKGKKKDLRRAPNKKREEGLLSSLFRRGKKKKKKNDRDEHIAIMGENERKARNPERKGGAFCLEPPVCAERKGMKNNEAHYTKERMAEHHKKEKKRGEKHLLVHDPKRNRTEVPLSHHEEKESI